ncbi:MAG: universal stress protein [Gemmatimonadetes bacterium]|nr:universal stress protein [Gemmatimonadota bacterium]
MSLGRAADADYTLLRGVPVPYHVGSAHMPHSVHVDEEKLENARREATAYLEGLAERLRREGFSVRTHIFLGAHPALGILEYAEKNPTDIIAMATHGRSGVARLLVGSVADKVVRGTHAPLLLYRPEHH